MGLASSQQNLSTLNWNKNRTENYDSRIDLNDNNVNWIIKNISGENNNNLLSSTTSQSIFISPQFVEGGAKKNKTSTTQSNKFNKSSNISDNSSEIDNQLNYTSSNISNSISVTDNLKLKKDLSSINSSIHNSSTHNSSTHNSSTHNSSVNNSTSTVSASNSTLNTNDLNIISHPTTAN